MYFSFILLVTPEISKHPNDATKVERENVVFSCSAVGNRSPIVHWTKNGERLNVEANPRVNASSTSNIHSLTITDIRETDAGQYRCVAESSVGSSASSAATLIVACKLIPLNNV